MGESAIHNTMLSGVWCAMCRPAMLCTYHGHTIVMSHESVPTLLLVLCHCSDTVSVRIYLYQWHFLSRHCMVVAGVPGVHRTLHSSAWQCVLSIIWTVIRVTRPQHGVISPVSDLTWLHVPPRVPCMMMLTTMVTRWSHSDHSATVPFKLVLTSHYINIGHKKYKCEIMCYEISIKYDKT